MRIEPTTIADVLVITPERHQDARGFFAEIYNRRRFAEAGIDADFVQDNHAMSLARGTLRGLHYQSPPHAQSKLVHALRGRILDIAVDLRRSSPTFGRHVMVELDAASGRMLFIPKGFAHGALTLEPETEHAYKVDAHWSPDHDRGLAFDDPDLAIPWPISPFEMTLSDRDRRHPRLRDLPPEFD